MRRIVSPLSMVLCSLFVAGCVGSPARDIQEATFDREIDVTGPANVEVSTGSGNVEVHAAAGNRVEIHGTVRGGNFFWWSASPYEVERVAENPPIEKTGNTIRIGRLHNRVRNVSISYVVYVPAETDLRVSTGSGRLTVDGLTGRVDGRTGSGSISLIGIRGEVEAETGSGSIRASDVRGGLRMRTGSGTIRVQGEQTDRWDMETGSGSIEVDLPPDSGFELSAHTGSGGINVDYPNTSYEDNRRDRHDVRATVGDGAETLRLRTGSGHIRVY